MDETASRFAQPSLLIIFAYAQAGLGHLRVTDALYHGLPAHTNAILLHSQEASIGYLHHLTSIHPVTRALLEWLQRGEPEELFTRFYRHVLRSNTHWLYEHMAALIDERYEMPTTVLIVATHFGLAHQLAAIKDKLSREKQVKIILALQVTDDSPQRIWYVEGADLIVVPSAPTQAALAAYGRQEGLPQVHFAVLPYPVSPLLTALLSDADYGQRQQEMQADSPTEIQIAIPISGAAVGLTFFRQLIDALHARSSRFHFQVVAKSAPYTQAFLRDLQSLPYVTLHTGTTDREVVEQYEQLYENVLVALEVTKPSEQAFKALVSPQRRGGTLLLFSHPVGRQEDDNLAFLQRHRLLPTAETQRALWEYAAQERSLSASESALLNKALTWRGLRLPDDPVKAADLIGWTLQQGVFSQMIRCVNVPQPDDPAPQELSAEGVNEFWKAVSGLLGS